VRHCPASQRPLLGGISARSGGRNTGGGGQGLAEICRKSPEERSGAVKQCRRPAARSAPASTFGPSDVAGRFAPIPILERDAMTIPRRQFLQLAAATAALPVMGRPAPAQSWPTKTIRAIIPLSAGSTIDVVGRIVFEPLAQQIGHSI